MNITKALMTLFLLFSNFFDDKVIKLICDGCGSQNKYSTLVEMSCNCLLRPNNRNANSITWINIIFPDHGHSFMPTERRNFIFYSFIEKDYIRVMDWKKTVTKVITPNGILSEAKFQHVFVHLFSEDIPIITSYNRQFQTKTLKNTPTHADTLPHNTIFKTKKVLVLAYNKYFKNDCMKSSLGYFTMEKHYLNF